MGDEVDFKNVRTQGNCGIVYLDEELIHWDPDLVAIGILSDLADISKCLGWAISQVGTNSPE